MVSQAERRKATRNAIMTAASVIIDARGFNDCSIAAIANETSYSTGAIQHHFKSKDELLYSVVTEHVFSMPTPEIGDSIIRESLEKRCRLIIQAMWSYYGHKNYSLVWEIILGSKRNEKLRTAINSFFRAAETKAEANIQKVFSDISFTSEYVVDLRRYLSAQLRGISLLRFTNDVGDDISIQLDYLTETMVLKVGNDAGIQAQELA